MKIVIGNRIIGEGQPVFIIAEAGVNHNGKLSLAKKMVDAAKLAGVDAVKFQTFKTENIAIHSCAKAEYQKRYGDDETQFRMLKRLELSEPDFRELFNYCKKKKVLFLSTPFDHDSAGFLHRLGVPAFKISSGDLTNLPLLKEVACYKKPMIISTGMSDMVEIKEAVKCVVSAENSKIVLLHCTSSYPAGFDDVNLKAMKTMARTFKLPVGLSDHTEGIIIPIAACAMGACVIEKHFTLNKDMQGPDHKASLSPAELIDMVRSVKNVERAMGTGEKAPARNEEAARKVIRKSVVSLARIAKGEKIEGCMIAVKRPATGIKPKYFDRIIGKKAKKDIAKDEVLTWEKVKI